QPGGGRPVVPLRRGADEEAADVLVAVAQFAHIGDLRVVAWGDRWAPERFEDLLGVTVIEPASRGPDRGANRERRQIRQSADVVEMEVGEHDLQLVDPLQKPRIAEQPAGAGADVDHQRAVTVTDQVAGRLPDAGGRSAAAAEDADAG